MHVCITSKLVQVLGLPRVATLGFTQCTVVDRAMVKIHYVCVVKLT